MKGPLQNLSVFDYVAEVIDSMWYIGMVLMLTMRSKITRLKLCFQLGLLNLSNGCCKMIFAGYQKPICVRLLHQLQQQDKANNVNNLKNIKYQYDQYLENR